MDRRKFFMLGARAGASLCALGMANRRLLADTLQQSRHKLTPVRVAPDRELRTVVGLRPYRPSGFVVRAQKLDDTVVVHNYGHGGAGITLSWGTAHLAVELGCQGHEGPVAVLGSGAVGLTTARLLQEAGFMVTLYTKAMPEQTTSCVAGGEWFPFLVADPLKSEPGFHLQLLQASQYAFNRFQTMIGPAYGVHWTKNYNVLKRGFNEAGPTGMQSEFRGMMPEYRDLDAHEHPFAAEAVVRQFNTLMIEPPTFLPALLKDFREASGRVVLGEIADPAAIAQLPEKLVFNCTGLGAKDIFGDEELTAVRGQLTMLKPQPEVDYAVAHDELYMLPRTDGILLGGTYELGMTSLLPDMEKKRQILARHKAFFDSYRRVG